MVLSRFKSQKNDSDSGDLPVAPRFLSAHRNDADTVIFVMEERCKDPELIVPGADQAKYWKTLKACLGVGLSGCSVSATPRLC